MKSLGSLLFALSICASCARPLPLPVISAPELVSRDEPLPSPELSTLSIPVQVPLDALEALLREHVALPNLDDYQVVTEPGKSPEIAIRYTAALLSPAITSAGDTVQLTLPIAYHGSFRARVKTPFGWVWLTKGTDWGTADAQGRIDLAIESKLEVARDWTLSTHSSLRDVTLTAPPVEQLCTRGAFKICVPAEWARARVHGELERRVRDALARGLAQVDAGVAERVNLPGVAQNVWQRLNQPHALANSSDVLNLAPSRIGITPPGVRGALLGADLRVWCYPRFTESEARPTRGLPAPATGAWPGEGARFRLRLPLTELTSGLTNALAQSPLQLESGARVTGLAVLGSAADEGRWFVALTLIDEDARTFTAYVSAALSGAGTALGLEALAFTPDSERLLELAQVAPDELARLVSQKLKLELGRELQARAAALRSALAGALAPWPTDPMSGLESELAGVYAARDGIVLDVRVH